MSYYMGENPLKSIRLGEKRVKLLYQGDALLYDGRVPFTPLDLGDALGCWFDAGNAADLSAGTNSVISEWRSVTGDVKATPYSNTSAFYRPSGYDALAPYVQFSSSSLTASYIGSANPKAIFCVYLSQSVNITGSLFAAIPHSGDTRFYLGLSDYGGCYYGYYGQASLIDQVFNITSPNINTSRKYIAVMNHDTGLHMTQHVDGVKVADATAASGTIGRSNNFMLGYNAASKQKVKEIGYIDRALTEEERQMLEGYLAHKYGQQAYLPAGHPYKDTVPLV